MKDTASLRDEIRQERLKSLEGKPAAYRVKYYIYYYKWYVVAFIALIILVCSIVKTVRSNKDSVLGVAIVNGVYGADYDGFERELETVLNVGEKEEVVIDSEYTISPDNSSGFDMQSEEKLFVMIATGQLDVIIAPESVFGRLADVAYLEDLGNVLDRSELEGCDIYIGHVADDSVDAVDNDNALRHEELSGIEVSKLARIASLGWFENSSEPVYLGFVAGGKHMDNAVEFFEYLREDDRSLDRIKVP